MSARTGSKKNPYRGTKFQDLATKIGASGFNQNCARCHGIEAISGGLAPDLRYLDKGADGDAWFINRIRHGYTQNGVTKMPHFEGILSQEAMWAIRTYLELPLPGQFAINAREPTRARFFRCGLRGAGGLGASAA